jgi:hypothetical protein
MDAAGRVSALSAEGLYQPWDFIPVIKPDIGWVLLDHRLVYTTRHLPHTCGSLPLGRTLRLLD